MSTRTPLIAGNWKMNKTATEGTDLVKAIAAAVGIDATRGDKIEVLNVRFNRDLAVVGGEEAASPLLDFTKNDIMRGVELLVIDGGDGATATREVIFIHGGGIVMRCIACGTERAVRRLEYVYGAKVGAVVKVELVD